MLYQELINGMPSLILDQFGLHQSPCRTVFIQSTKSLVRKESRVEAVVLCMVTSYICLSLLLYRPLVYIKKKYRHVEC